MRVNQTLVKVAVAAALACGASAASAASMEGEGFYFGVSGGQATYDVNKGELDNALLNELFFAGFPVTSATSSLDDSDTAWSVFAGYRFNRYLAIEGGYQDLGAATYSASGTVNPPGPVASVPLTIGLDFESSGFTVSGIGALPLGDSFDIHARLGVYFADTEEKINVGTTGFADNTTLSASSTDYYYGLGVGFHLGENWSFGIDYALFKDIGEEEETDEVDITVLTASVIYRL